MIAAARLLRLALPFLGTLLFAGAADAQPISGGIDLLELHPSGENTQLHMESTFELGEGTRTFGLKVDGGSDTRPMFDEVQVQALWMPTVAPGAKLAMGVRHDLRGGHDLTYAVAGIEADLLPWLTGEHYFYLSNRGDLTGGAKFVASFPLSRAFTLEPRAQLGWAARDIPLEGLAAGLTDYQLSVRLRHKLGPHLDVYGGAIHAGVAGRSAAMAREAGDPVHITRAVIGAGFTF